ncbi:hypothetical protein ACSNN7_01100 [Micromonospora sp. URMC 105]|uniref:hypothetical protein n=1 Tax=Micromonospora sp. URMC 105 TaxID=3423413 RepID=UPI003F1B7ED3
MTDYNWYSDQAVEVAVEGIRDEAKKWFDLSDRMARVAALAADQGLSSAAFSVTDLSNAVTAPDLQQGYEKMQFWLTDLFRQAVTEFDKFGGALKRCADWYEDTDVNAKHDFDQIASS